MKSKPICYRKCKQGKQLTHPQKDSLRGKSYKSIFLISQFPRLFDSFLEILRLDFGCKMSMDLDAPVYMAGTEPEQPTTAT